MATADVILKNAVENFANARRAPRDERKNLTALISSYYPAASTDARKLCSLVLARFDAVPIEIIDLIISDEAKISLPFIRLARTIDEDNHLIRIAQEGSVQERLAVARRRFLPKPVERVLRSFNETEVNRALDLRQRSEITGEIRMADSRFSHILEACQNRDLTTLCELLSQKLSITEQTAFILLADKKSANLIVALKYIGMNAPDAWMIFSLLAPGLADDDNTRSDFKRTYDAYSIEQCSELVRGWIYDDLLGEALKPLSHQDSGSIEHRYAQVG
ncbi:MAG: hypothetical protein AAGI92_06475 [Pseudomonadota bacterium]